MKNQKLAGLSKLSFRVSYINDVNLYIRLVRILNRLNREQAPALHTYIIFLNRVLAVAEQFIFYLCKTYFLPPYHQNEQVE